MIKIRVSSELKGELVLSAIRAKLRAGSVVEISEDAAANADVLWAKKKGYISFDSDTADSAETRSSSEHQVEFINAMKGGVTIPFLGKTISSQQRFILNKDDKNMEKAMKLVEAGYLTCSNLASIPSPSVAAKVQEKKPAKKGARKTFRRNKSGGEAEGSAEIFGLMNTEVT